MDAKERKMNASTKTIEVSIVTVIEERSTRGFAGLISSFRRLISKAASEPKDATYADYLETMAVLTGF
jgi:hypothetical protein